MCGEEREMFFLVSLFTSGCGLHFMGLHSQLERAQKTISYHRDDNRLFMRKLAMG